MDLPKCKQIELHATHQNFASCGDIFCKQCACGMNEAGIQGDTGVVSAKIGDYNIYFCDQDCAAEYADFTKNTQGAHHECAELPRRQSSGWQK